MVIHLHQRLEKQEKLMTLKHLNVFTQDWGF